MSARKYELAQQPGHRNAPDAWIVWSTEFVQDEDGELIRSTDVVCSGQPLKEALAQIALMEEIR